MIVNSNFGRQLSTVIRGLYVLGEAAKHHPVIIPSTLNQYSEKVKGGSEAKVANTATAIGLLEILNNTNLLYIDALVNGEGITYLYES